MIYEIYIVSLSNNMEIIHFKIMNDLSCKPILLYPSRPNLGRREKIKLNFYFHTFDHFVGLALKGLSWKPDENSISYDSQTILLTGS